jgi:hypothetical protein
VAGSVPDGHWAPAEAAFLALRIPYGLGDDPARARWPNLLAFLTDRQTPKGKTIEVPRLTLVATAEGWTATVQHFTLSVKVVANFRYLADLLGALEAKWLPGATGWSATKTGEAAKRRAADEASQLAKSQDPLYHLAKGGGDPRKQG